MCGIAGSLHLPLDIPKLTSDLMHRGPDEQTTYQDGAVLLHHHRLAILDIGGGRQPMHYEHLTIIFNGEIYNHQDLRRKHGLTSCRTNSDTETILHLYAKLGMDGLKDMDGMFALAIHDKKAQQLFLARDRAGKKPLYYYSDNKKLVFASELNALRNQLPLTINEVYVREFARTGYIYNTHTPYLEVKELPAASCATIDINSTPLTINVQSWWNIEQFYNQPSADSEAVALEKVDQMLHTAVKRRVESSDLEVGSFLSGGIDSGLVTAIAKQYNSTLKTFTVSFDGEYDEAPFARQVADKYKTDHHELRISFDNLRDEVETIVANYGEPFYDDSAIPSYYVSREARKYLTVILNGDGGDEIFGGYRRYVPFSKIDFFKKSALRQSVFRIFHSLTPVSDNKMNKLNYLRRMMFLGSGSGFDTYLRATTDIFEGFAEKAFINEVLPAPDMAADFEKVFSSSLTGLQKMMLLDFQNILPAVLLVKMDIATMAHSLEGRSPLLCKEVLEYVPTLSDDLKINGTQTKYLLRKLAARYLPDDLINLPKRGFEIPLKQWVNGQLRDIIGDYLGSASALYPTFMNKRFVSGLLDESIKVPSEKRAKMLWLLFTLEVWYRKVYKQ
jgi:asparagine synthase (glutamine-hydrolysing)